MKVSLILLPAMLALAGCSIASAQMVQPMGLGGANAVPMAGIGGGRSGDFTIGDAAGDFTRSAGRVSFFGDLIERQKGSTAFTLNGAALGTPVSAMCRMRERTVNYAFVTFVPSPMSYRCAFTQDGRDMAARFDLLAALDGGPSLAVRRAGEVSVGDAVIRMRSEHRVAGTGTEMAEPFGYVFESKGRALGSVELNGTPQLRMHSGASADERRAMLLAAVALGLFWDPVAS